MKTLTNTILFVFPACALLAQTPSFEVASIRPAAPPQITQGPGGATRVAVRMGARSDPGRVAYNGLSLKDLVARAYGLKPYQVTGPSWMESERYDITAKIPEGVSEDKTPDMLQNLLAERFQMKTHKESKDLPVYALIVGKNGPKLKKSEDTGDAPVMVGPEGAKVALPRGSAGAMMMDGTGKMTISRTTMPRFADSLSRMLDRPVLDMTGVEGTYDVTLEVSMEDLVGMKRMAGGAGGAVMVHGGGGGGASEGPAPDSNPRGSIFSAVAQLGLKLDARKSPVEIIVVDKAEKPTEN
jgi:uncharacterized protein (TIGR03435 family)